MHLTTAMLADAATVERGKLFVHGAGWDSIFVETFPATHPSMAVVLIVQVEYSEALQDIPFLIELLDEDDAEMGPRLEAVINVGHPPGSRPGAPTLVPLQWTLQLLTLDRAGGYRFRVSADPHELGSVPFRVAQRR
jgi:hypothetical protein